MVVKKKFNQTSFGRLTIVLLGIIGLWILFSVYYSANFKDKGEAEAKSSNSVVSDSDVAIGMPADSVNDRESEPFRIDYDYLHWSENFSGLKAEINEVSISKKTVLNADDATLVAIHLKLTNSSAQKMKVHPEQGKIFIGGKQYEADIQVDAKNLGGDLLSGASQEGTVTFTIQPAAAPDTITEMLYVWDAFNDSQNKHEFEADFKF